MRWTSLFLAGGLAIMGLAVIAQPADAIVRGQRDCLVNQLGTPGSGCSYPTVGVNAYNQGVDGLLGRCSNRLIYNGPERAVVLTAAHCTFEFDASRGDGVNFDSQVVDDTVTPYKRDVIQPDRVVVPDQVITHPGRNAVKNGTDGVNPHGRTNPRAAFSQDVAFLVITDPAKLARLNSLWTFPHGQLVALPAAGFFDRLSQTQLDQLPLIDVGLGADWVDYDKHEGIGGFNNASFRTVANLQVAHVAYDHVRIDQRFNTDLSGACYGDSGSSAFVQDSATGGVTILAMPTWVDGANCYSWMDWMRFDQPVILDFLKCAFAEGGADATSECVKTTFPIAH